MTRGAAWGLSVAPLVAVLCWWLGQGELRPWALLLGVIGAAAGLAYRVRRRWSDLDVALYLDARMGTDELVTSAIAPHSDESGCRRVLIEKASAALEQAEPRSVGPGWWQHRYLVGLLGAGAVGAVSHLALPAGPSTSGVEPGQQIVTKADLRSLDPIIDLERLDSRDSAQHERLQRIAEQARRLRTDLERGLEKREALARVAKLRDDVAAEHLLLGDGSTRRGLEAAVRKLGTEPQTSRLAQALGRGDLTEFDQEMQRLANLAEGEARVRARQALEQAREVARRHQAEKVARLLEEQSRLFAEREGKASATRELARALGSKLDEETLRDLEEFGATGSSRAGERLAQALEKALLGLGPEERKRLAEKLEQRLRRGALDSPMAQQELERLTRRLSSPDGQRELAQALKELAKNDPGSEARREQGLGEAERGGAEAQRELGALPLPIETPGPRPGRADRHNPAAAPSGATGTPGPGSKHDRGTASHDGKTEPITAEALRSKARVLHDPRFPMQGTSLGRAPGKAGDVARTGQTGVVGNALPAAIGGTERSEIPEEYREQVGRYFSPER